MRGNSTINEPLLSEEQIAIIAEKGIENARLSRREKEYLVANMGEAYDALEFIRAPEPAPLPSSDIDALMSRFFAEKISQEPVRRSGLDIWVAFKENFIETIESGIGWLGASPAFATRAVDTKAVSFHKNVGKFSVHLEIMRRDERLADINVKVTDTRDHRPCPFDAELYRDNRCVEMVTAMDSAQACFSSVDVSDYVLKVSDRNNEITSISLRMQP